MPAAGPTGLLVSATRTGRDRALEMIAAGDVHVDDVLIDLTNRMRLPAAAARTAVFDLISEHAVTLLPGNLLRAA